MPAWLIAIAIMVVIPATAKGVVIPVMIAVPAIVMSAIPAIRMPVIPAAVQVASMPVVVVIVVVAAVALVAPVVVMLAMVTLTPVIAINPVMERFGRVGLSMAVTATRSGHGSSADSEWDCQEGQQRQ